MIPEIQYTPYAKHIRGDEWHTIVAPPSFDNFAAAAALIEIEMSDDPELDWEFKIVRTYK